MIIETHNTDKKVLLVAEIGNNHEGSYALAEDMIGHAKESGADAVKFQTFIPELFVSRENKARFDRLKKFQLQFSEFESLANTAKKLGLIFFSTPLDLESALFLNTIQSVFKIASSDNTFYPLIDTIAQFKKPIIVSTGLVDTLEVQAIHAYILSKLEEDNSLLSILHCITAYPVPDTEVNLSAITALKKQFPHNTIGYSDHTLGISASIYAVALGARIIEKHFTIDNNFSDFRDHQLSANPTQFKELSTEIRRLEILLGTEEKKVQSSEACLKPEVRRSLAAARKITKGTVVRHEDIIWIRPGNGIPAGQENQIIGKTLKIDLEQGDLFSYTIIE